MKSKHRFEIIKKCTICINSDLFTNVAVVRQSFRLFVLLRVVVVKINADGDEDTNSDDAKSSSPIEPMTTGSLNLSHLTRKRRVSSVANVFRVE